MFGWVQAVGQVVLATATSQAVAVLVVLCKQPFICQQTQPLLLVLVVLVLQRLKVQGLFRL
jgi:hypothetical protein